VTRAQAIARLQKAEVAETVSEGETVTIKITPVWVGGDGVPDEKGETVVYSWKAKPGMMWKSADARARKRVRW